jgi:hypothetical protein
MRRIISWAAVALIATVGAVLIGPYFFPWTPLNCSHLDIDIRTGRVRWSRYLAFCKVSERVDQTSLVRLLPSDRIAATEPDWQRVSTFSPGVNHSPHYRFHGAIGQIRDLELIWQDARVDASTRLRMALHLLALWQFDESDRMAGNYIDGLSDLHEAGKRESLLKSIRALEIPEERVESARVVITVRYPDGRLMERVEGYRDPGGQFVRHGLFETWHANGKRQCYGHCDRGTHHDRRFEWNDEGKLITIEVFDHNELADYESEDLEKHPDYEEARRVAEGRPDACAGGSDRPRP